MCKVTVKEQERGRAVELARAYEVHLRPQLFSKIFSRSDELLWNTRYAVSASSYSVDLHCRDVARSRTANATSVARGAVSLGLELRWCEVQRREGPRLAEKMR